MEAEETEVSGKRLRYEDTEEDNASKKQKTASEDVEKDVDYKSRLRERKSVEIRKQNSTDDQTLKKRKVSSKKFTPSKLETIFESKDSPQVPPDLVGRKKIKRSINLSDGFTVNKNLTKKRISRIKKYLGRKPKRLKKLPMEVLLEKLKPIAETIASDGTLL